MNAKHAKPARVHMKNPSLKSKIMVLIVCLSLSLTLVFSGASSFAWMYTAKKTDTITFTKTSLSITIADAAGQQLIPGKTYTLSAAPQASVEASSVPCYLFVHVVESIDQFADFTYASGWTQVGSTGYYYQTVAASSSKQSCNVFASNQVKAKDALVHSSGTLTAGKITINYCAIQQANLTAANAQAQVAKVI